MRAVGLQGRAAALCIAVAAWGACGDEEAPATTNPVVSLTTVGGGSTGLGGAGGAGGASTGGGPGGAASTPPVFLGVSTSPVDLGPVEPAEAQLAELTAFAAGVRLVRIDVPWSELDLVDLAARVQAHREDERRVVVRLLVVERKAAHRPEATASEAWDAPEVVAALEADVAAIAAMADGGVDAIGLGSDVDVYLDHAPDEAAGLTALLAAGLAAAPPTTLIGCGFTSGSLDATRHPAPSLLDASSAILLSYRPGQDDAEVSSPAKDLDRISEAAAGRPVVLATAFSSAGPQRTEETQRQSLDGFFAALTPRRASFPYIVVEQLHDLPPERCALWATAQQEAIDGDWATFRCHTGVRTALDAPKAAWLRLLQATAQLASP